MSPPASPAQSAALSAPASAVWSAAGTAAWAGAGLLWLALLLIPLAAVWERSPDLAHGWAAPLLMLHLWWERLPAIARRPVSPSNSTRVLVFTAVLAAAFLRLLLEPFPLWPAVLAAHSGLLVALGGAFALAYGGRAWAARLLAPCIVLAGALPWPGLVERVFIQPLREGLASAAAEVVTLLAQPAVAQGTSVRLAGGWVGIDEACGGIRSLQAAVMLALFFGELGRFAPLRRLALVAAGVAAALLGNFARILFLAFSATEGAEKIHAVHDLAGWLALGLTLTGVGLVAWLLRPRANPAPPSATSPAPAASPTAPLLRASPAARLVWVLPPLLALGLAEWAVRAWYDSGEAATSGTPRWEARLPHTQPSFQAEPLGQLAREMLQPDEYLAGHWRDESGERVAAYTLEWRRGQLARTLPFLHNPTVCLPLSGCELREERGTHVFRFGDLALPFRSYLFSRAGEEFVISFIVWDPFRGEALRQPEDTPDLPSWLAIQWREVRERRRHQPAQMLCLAVYGTDPEARTQRLLEAIVQTRKSE